VSLPSQVSTLKSIHWAAILAATGAIISAVVLVVGAWVARLYLLRVTAQVDATCHPLPNGLLLHVRVQIRSTGLTRLHLLSGDDQRPTVSVAEHRLGDSKRLSSGLILGTRVSQPAFVNDEVLDPGETISDSVYFLVPPQVAATLGWRVHFTFSLKKQRGEGEWVYVAATFVPHQLVTSSSPSIPEHQSRYHEI
jgi:hypothetical protein